MCLLCFIKFLFFHQMIILQKLWKKFFISPKKLFLFLRYSNFCIFYLPFHLFEIQKEKWKWNNLWCHGIGLHKFADVIFGITQILHITNITLHHQTWSDNIKSHMCEEGGAHPRISVWCLLMNLKNNILLKKLLQWANKKYKYFNIYRNYKKKIKKYIKKNIFIILYLCTNNLHDTIYSSWDIECERLKLAIMDRFLPFNPPPPSP